MFRKIEEKVYLFWFTSLLAHVCFLLIPLHVVNPNKDSFDSVKMRFSYVFEKKIVNRKKDFPKKKEISSYSEKMENVVIQQQQSDEIPQLDFSSIEGPKIKSRFSPLYPYTAKKMGKGGVVKVRILINEHGKAVSWTFIESCGKEFEKSVEEEIKKTVFEPAVKDGIPIVSYGVLPVRFEIKE